MTKNEEYDLMVISKPYALTTPVTGGKAIKWLKVWDHNAGTTETSFKTTMPPPYKHKLISFQVIDLMPARNLKIYKITIKKR